MTEEIKCDKCKKIMPHIKTTMMETDLYRCDCGRKCEVEIFLNKKHYYD